MNEGIARAAFIVRCHMRKQAGVANTGANAVLGAGKAIQTTGRALTGAGRAWGEGASAAGRSVTRQMRGAKMRHSRLAGGLTSGALKAAPWLAAGYLGYRAFEPEVHSAKHRLGQAVRGRVALYKARRRAAMPYYNEGRFQ